jgi:hypothetical protein
VVGRAVNEQLAPISAALEPLAQAVSAQQEAEADAYAEQNISGTMDQLGVPEHAREQVLFASGGYRLAGLPPDQALAAAAEQFGRTTMISPPAGGRPSSMLESAERIARASGLWDGGRR